MLVGREKEFTKIESLITDAFQQRSPLSIYISGPPGTGKTATTKAVIQNLQPTKQRNKIRHAYIDCFGAFTISALCKEILDILGATIHQNKRIITIRTLAEHIGKISEPILILLDEIDNLLSTQKGANIFSIFNLSAQFPGKVIVIGISNSLDLIERILPKRKFTHPPQSIIFAAYTSDQLIHILEERLREENLDNKTMELCARKVSSMTGDIRQALGITAQILADIQNEEKTFEDWVEEEKENLDPRLLLRTHSRGCRKSKAANSKEERGDGGQSKPGTPNLKRAHPKDKGEVTPKKNACREVLNAINKTTASPCQRSKLPQHPAILLATLMRLIKNCSTVCFSTTSSQSIYRTPPRTPNSKNTTTPAIIPERMSVGIDRLFQAYINVCEGLFLRPLEADDLNSAYEVLESQAMIKLTKKAGRESVEQYVCLMVEMSLAYQTINDNSLLASIENMAEI